MDFLRHAVATLAYRAGKTLKGTPPDFADFSAGAGVRTPGQILAHVGDLFDWALALAKGEYLWHDSDPLPWPQELERFQAGLARFDEYLNGPVPLACPAERLLQGPVADAFTHIGQIGMLRRLAGSPVPGENYFKAEIAAGKLVIE